MRRGVIDEKGRLLPWRFGHAEICRTLGSASQASTIYESSLALLFNTFAGKVTFNLAKERRVFFHDV